MRKCCLSWEASEENWTISWQGYTGNSCLNWELGYVSPSIPSAEPILGSLEAKDICLTDSSHGGKRVGFGSVGLGWRVFPYLQVAPCILRLM